jgi:hypothetical protein
MGGGPCSDEVQNFKTVTTIRRPMSEQQKSNNINNNFQWRTFFLGGLFFGGLIHCNPTNVIRSGHGIFIQRFVEVKNASTPALFDIEEENVMIQQQVQKQDTILDNIQIPYTDDNGESHQSTNISNYVMNCFNSVISRIKNQTLKSNETNSTTNFEQNNTLYSIYSAKLDAQYQTFILQSSNIYNTSTKLHNKLIKNANHLLNQTLSHTNIGKLSNISSSIVGDDSYLSSTAILSSVLGVTGLVVGVPYVPGITDNLVVGALGSALPYFTSIQNQTYSMLDSSWWKT